MKYWIVPDKIHNSTKNFRNHVNKLDGPDEPHWKGNHVELTMELRAVHMQTCRRKGHEIGWRSKESWAGNRQSMWQALKGACLESTGEKQQMKESIMNTEDPGWYGGAHWTTKWRCAWIDWKINSGLRRVVCARDKHLKIISILVYLNQGALQESD